MTPFILMIGLGVHSIFEGISVGLNRSFEGTAVMALAILLHKGAAGMSLGSSMAKAFPDRDNHVIMLLFMFAIFTPLGIAIGWAADQDSPLTEIIFSCLAAGTFIYIACSEVIIEEFSSPQNKWFKFIFYIMGIAFIASLKFVESEDDD